MKQYFLDTDVCTEIIKHNERVHFDHIPNIELEDWAQRSKYKKK